MVSLIELRSAVIDTIRRECAFDTVSAYAGQFAAEEVAHESYATPACFVSVLAVTPAQTLAARVAHGYTVNFGAYVVADGGRRVDRANDALCLVAKLLDTIFLNRWGCDCSLAAPFQINAQNLFNRSLDALGQALWGVRFAIEVKRNAEEIRHLLKERNVA